MSHDVRLSKTLSWILRHGATKVNLSLDDGGNARVSDLLRLQQLKGFNLTDIERVVANNNKQRFTMSTDEHGESLIRANQGHSIRLENLELSEISSSSDCPIAVHGTRWHLWPTIAQRGLSRMNRQHVHMAPGLPSDGGVISGMRQNCDLLIFIDVDRAISEELKFFRSTNEVILCSGDSDGFIDRRFFKRVVRVMPSGEQVKIDFDTS